LERWREYIDSLPGGLAAFPELTCKAVLSRSFHESFGKPTLQADVPPEVRQLVDAPSPVSVFVPEVHTRACYLAMGDALGWSDDELVHRCRVANDELLGGLLYRAIFTFVSTTRLLSHVSSRWDVFHRGTKVVMDAVEPNRCVVLTREPPLFTNELLARMHSTALGSALTAVGARDVVVTSRATPDVRYEARWTT
jgi:hypothetical protein